MTSVHSGLRGWALVLIVFLLLVSLGLNGLALWRSFSLVNDVQQNALTIGGIGFEVDSINTYLGINTNTNATQTPSSPQDLLQGTTLI